MSRIEGPAEQTNAMPPAPAGAPRQEIVYPESDGQPMADNTEQFDWIVTIKLNLEARFAGDPDVFVAGDLLWYPVEGEPKIRQAPDVMVAFGRPKGRRGSYQQWIEGGIAPQVVVEVLSPGNRLSEMTRKQAFYERHGVEEYYVIDPEHFDVSGLLRKEGRFEVIEEMNGWVSPRLGVRFQIESGKIALFHPDGRAFEEFVEAIRRADLAEARAEAEARAREQERLAREQAERELERLRRLLQEQGIEMDPS